MTEVMFKLHRISVVLLISVETCYCTEHRICEKVYLHTAAFTAVPLLASSEQDYINCEQVY